jgi:hypothetical protein
MVVSPFLIDALLGFPETEKAQPIKVTDWAPVVVCGGLATAAYGRISNGSSHLLSLNGFWMDLSLAE